MPISDLAPLPAANVSLFERPGILRREWFLFFQSVDLALRTLRDDAAATPSALKLQDGAGAPVAIPGAALMFVDTADGDLKVTFSDGITKTIVTDT